MQATRLDSNSLDTRIDYSEIWRIVENLPWCALISSGRAGSDAFQSQLDSHPEIFVFNGQVDIQKFWNSESHAVEYGAEGFGEYDVEDIVDEFIGRHIKLLKSRYDSHENKHRLGENLNQSIDIDLDLFRTHIVSLLILKPLCSRNMLIAVYVAYALCLGQKIQKKKLFFHHAHQVTRLDSFLADFPESRIIGTTRDPRAAYVSYIEHWRRVVLYTRHPYLPRWVLHRIVESLDPLGKYGDRFRVLRLEDMADEEVLAEVCEWLGVSFHSCMAKSTWAGLRWWGDRLSTVAPNPGLSEKEFTASIRRSNWNERLPAFDKFVLNYLLYPRLIAYSYECKKTPTLIYGPLVFLAIALPTNYEREWMVPSRLFSLLAKSQYKLFIGVFIHYAKRVFYFYRLFFRQHSGRWSNLPLFRSRQ